MPGGGVGFLAILAVLGHAFHVAGYSLVTWHIPTRTFEVDQALRSRATEVHH